MRQVPLQRFRKGTSLIEVLVMGVIITGMATLTLMLCTGLASQLKLVRYQNYSQDILYATAHKVMGTNSSMATLVSSIPNTLVIEGCSFVTTMQQITSSNTYSESCSITVTWDPLLNGQAQSRVVTTYICKPKV